MRLRRFARCGFVVSAFADSSPPLIDVESGGTTSTPGYLVGTGGVETCRELRPPPATRTAAAQRIPLSTPAFLGGEPMTARSTAERRLISRATDRPVSSPAHLQQRRRGARRRCGSLRGVTSGKKPGPTGVLDGDGNPDQKG